MTKSLCGYCCCHGVQTPPSYSKLMSKILHRWVSQPRVFAAAEVRHKFGKNRSASAGGVKSDVVVIAASESSQHDCKQTRENKTFKTIRCMYLLMSPFQRGVGIGFEVSGSEEGIFWKTVFFQRCVLVLEVLEIAEEGTQSVEKRRIREFRDFSNSDSGDSSSEEALFVVTPVPVPESVSFFPLEL